MGYVFDRKRQKNNMINLIASITLLNNDMLGIQYNTGLA